MSFSVQYYKQYKLKEDMVYAENKRQIHINLLPPF